MRGSSAIFWPTPDAAVKPEVIGPPEPRDSAVTSRIRREDLVFSRPFRLRGWKEPHLAGAYALETEEELIDGLSFTAYRRVGTTLTREATPGGHCRQVIPVEPADLEVAVAAERALADAPPASGTTKT